MRKHVVNCEIDGNLEEGERNIQITMNEFFVRSLEIILQQSKMTKEDKMDFIDKLIEKSKKI